MIMYLLQHLIEHKDENRENVKIIGIYSSAEKASEAALNLSSAPGFKDAPQGFSIDTYEVDKTFWLEGFGEAY